MANHDRTNAHGKRHGHAPTAPDAHPAAVPADSSEAGVAERAYAIYLDAGKQDGHDLEHWLKAESEVLRGHGAPTGSALV